MRQADYSLSGKSQICTRNQNEVTEKRPGVITDETSHSPRFSFSAESRLESLCCSHISVFAHYFLIRIFLKRELRRKWMSFDGVKCVVLLVLLLLFLLSALSSSFSSSFLVSIHNNPFRSKKKDTLPQILPNADYCAAHRSPRECEAKLEEVFITVNFKCADYVKAVLRCEQRGGAACLNYREGLESCVAVVVSAEMSKV